jgi:hypothetical protein
MMKSWRLLLLFVGVARASAAGAQNGPIEVDSCVSRIPASAFKRVPVFVQATADHAATGILPQADLFAQSVGYKLRDMLGGSEEKLPEADSVITWRLLWGEIGVTAHRNQPVTWSVPDWSIDADTLPHSPLRMLQNAIRAVVASRETVVIPEELPYDSLSFGLSLISPHVTESGKIIPAKSRQPTPVFLLDVPWTKPVEQTRGPNIDYPQISRTNGIQGNIRVMFQVNRSGRAVMETMTELWPRDLKRPTGELLVAYNAFMQGVRRGLPSARYSPAVVGGCVVSAKVVQTFEFKFP